MMTLMIIVVSFDHQTPYFWNMSLGLPTANAHLQDVSTTQFYVIMHKQCMMKAV